MKYSKFHKFLICMLLLLTTVLLVTACGTANPGAEVDTVVDEETQAAIEMSTSIREIASGMEESFNTTTEDTSEFAVTLTMIESAEALIRSALEEVAGELPEIQQEEVEKVLDQLYQAGILEEEAVYSLENLMFTYVYSGGILGGVHLQEPDDSLNTADASTDAASDSMPTAESNDINNTDALQVVVFNGFEDSSYRRDYYESLQQEWTNAGIGVNLDCDVSVADLANLDSYDVIIFSMHGSTYENQPILAINEEVTTDTDLLYSKYLTEDYSVAKVMYLDGTSHYWVLPDFFRNCYGADGLANKVIYSESCCFYGCDCYCSDVDTSFAQAMVDSSAEAVIGYYNSVGADYSRNMMKATLESMFDGATLDAALQNSINTYGTDDGWEEPTEDKYPAYPCYLGNAEAVLTTSVEVEQPTEEEVTPEESVPEVEEETTPEPEAETVPEEPAADEGNTYSVSTTYIEGWSYIEDGTFTVYFTPDSFYTEEGQLMASVGFRDYLYLAGDDVQFLQVGDTLLTGDYLGENILVTDISEDGMDVILNNQYLLYRSALLDVWLICDISGSPITYPSVWEPLPVTDDAQILSYGLLDIDPENPESTFSANPDVSSVLGYISITDEQITQIIFE